MKELKVKTIKTSMKRIIELGFRVYAVKWSHNDGLYSLYGYVTSEDGKKFGYFQNEPHFNDTTQFSTIQQGAFGLYADFYGVEPQEIQKIHVIESFGLPDFANDKKFKDRVYNKPFASIDEYMNKFRGSCVIEEVTNDNIDKLEFVEK